MAINIVPVNTGGSGVAPQQSVMRTPQVRPQFHPGPNPWAGITKAIDKSLPVISKIVKNKDTIEALQKAMGPKPDGSSKLTDMAYRIMEAGKATNDSSLFAQGVSMLQKQEGREQKQKIGETMPTVIIKHTEQRIVPTTRLYMKQDLKVEPRLTLQF